MYTLHTMLFCRDRLKKINTKKEILDENAANRSYKEIVACAIQHNKIIQLSMDFNFKIFFICQMFILLFNWNLDIYATKILNKKMQFYSLLHFFLQIL